MSLPNQVFSPDGDGFEDILMIDYNLDALGYVAKVMVFDAQGNFVKTLVDNELFGQTGSLKWDGSREDGQKARIGIYVLHFEVFNPSGIVKRYKKTCVVAGKMN